MPKVVGVLQESCPHGPCQLLVQAWRASAETGPASLVLSGAPDDPRVHWVSKTLAALLNLTQRDLVDRPLADLTEFQTAREERTGWVDLVVGLVRAGHGRGAGCARLGTRGDLPTDVEVVRLAGRSGPDGGPGEAAWAGPGWLVTLTPQPDEDDERDEALREAEARFTALAESAPIGIFLSEIGLRLGYVNDQFVALSEVAPYQLLGTEWLTVVDPQDVPGLCSVLEEVLRGERRELNVRLRSSEAGPRWVHLRLAPITTPSRAAGFIGVAEDVTQRRAWEDKITYQAHHDPLTGLVNRRRMIEVLRELLVGRRTRDRRFAVMFIDLDGFKTINDTYGHEIGDRVLVEVSRRMRRVAREYDLVSRVAGDEFVVVLRDVHDAAEAERAAQRQLQALRTPIRIGQYEQSVAASIGVAMPGPFDTVETLLRAADQVMYDAKSAGGSGYRMSQMPAAAEARPDVESAAGGDAAGSSGSGTDVVPVQTYRPAAVEAPR